MTATAMKKNPVKCLDGKEKTDYDGSNLKDATEAVCNFDGAASATVAGLALAVAAGLVAMLDRGFSGVP